MVKKSVGREEALRWNRTMREVCAGCGETRFVHGAIAPYDRGDECESFLVRAPATPEPPPKSGQGEACQMVYVSPLPATDGSGLQAPCTRVAAGTLADGMRVCRSCAEDMQGDGDSVDFDKPAPRAAPGPKEG